jgi:hypothetical protein
MPSSEQRDVRSLILYRHQWVRIRTRVQNALQAIASLSLTCNTAERRTALQSLYQQLEQQIEDLDRKVEELAWQRPQAGVLVPMRECLLENMILRSSDRSLNRRPACPRCGEFEAHHGQQGPKRCLVGNTETMKRMGRAGRVK